MRKIFNIHGDCQPQLHYMVDLFRRLQTIKAMVDAGQYFTMNRARQYGKTTTLQALAEFLQEDYTVISLDFQLISQADFETEERFTAAFSREILDSNTVIPAPVANTLSSFASCSKENVTLSVLFKTLMDWCRNSQKKLVLIIDEVDSASNNQVFLDFLSQLRGYYLRRRRAKTFWSVILAGVYDIKSIRTKVRPEDAHKINNPWNIAADFLVDMSFSEEEIAGMLKEYEQDCQTGMNLFFMAGLLFDYTSGYPFLVSLLCKCIDEQIAGSTDFPDLPSAWTKPGFLAAVRILLSESNTLFDSLLQKLEDYPELKRLLWDLLFKGQEISYVIGIRPIEIALMFGFVKVSANQVVIANRIFETLLYNLFLSSPEMQKEDLFIQASKTKGQFIEHGNLNMNRILERFIDHFHALYGDRGETFYEDDGRRYFMLFLKPIINGTGNCYVEAQTRNSERTDLIVDYQGEQFIIEMKIWHGPARHAQSEEQLCHYLDHYQLTTGYLLTFNFNRSKKIGLKTVQVHGKTLVEAMV